MFPERAQDQAQVFVCLTVVSPRFILLQPKTGGFVDFKWGPFAMNY